MATQVIRAPLQFRGTPALIEGLAPFVYKVVLAGATLRVTLAAEKGSALEISNVQTVPAGDSATWVRFSLPQTTVAGVYSGTVSLGDTTFPILVEVEGKPHLHISPPRLNLSAAAGASVTVQLTVMNAGNTPIEIPSTGGCGLFNVHGAEQSIGAAFRGEAQSGQDRLNKLVDNLASQHGGLALIQIQEGSGALALSELRNLKTQIRIPDAVEPGAIYSGTWSIANLRYPVRLEVANRPAANKKKKEVE